MILDYAQQQILNTYDSRLELMIEYLRTLPGREFSRFISKKFRQIEKDIPISIPEEYKYAPEITMATSAGREIQKYQDMFDVIDEFLSMEEKSYNPQDLLDLLGVQERQTA